MLDRARSCMQNKKTGQKTKVEYEDGQYLMYLSVTSKADAHKKSDNGVPNQLKGNHFAILAADSEQGFSGQTRNA